MILINIFWKTYSFDHFDGVKVFKIYLTLRIWMLKATWEIIVHCFGECKVTFVWLWTTISLHVLVTCITVLLKSTIWVWSFDTMVHDGLGCSCSWYFDPSPVEKLPYTFEELLHIVFVRLFLSYCHWMARGQDKSNQMMTPLFFIAVPLELSLCPDHWHFIWSLGSHWHSLFREALLVLPSLELNQVICLTKE